jgi:bifunctional pyridoxal-dependent enzyme with beta-cystathionase and maltose regulon repressor activities
LTSKPYYGRFELDFGNKSGVTLIGADTDHETCFDEDAVHAFEKTFQECTEEGVVVRAVLIVNPHNPLGKSSSPTTLRHQIYKIH